jgi:hypothetical protein
MSENFKNLRRHSGMTDGTADAKREAAVGAALTLILARAANSTASGALEGEMNNLAKYADQIQAALKTK